MDLTRFGCTPKTDRRPVFSWVVAAVVWLCPHVAQAQAEAAPPRAELRGVAAAIEACSSLGAAVARARIAQGDAAVADAAVLPNPDLVFNDNRSLTGPKDHETIVGLSVPLGLGGGRFVAQDAAAADRQAALLGAGQSAFEIALEVRARFARGSLAAARLAVWREQERAIAELIQRVERLELGGEAASYDALRLRARLAATWLRSKPARAGVEAERRWLEAVVGQPVAIEPDGASRLLGPRPSRSGPHPAVARLHKEAEADQLRASASERRWAPDVDVFVGYRTVGGLNQARGHGLSVNLTVPLTFFDHGQGEARRARARAELSEAQASLARRRFEAQKREARARDRALAAADPSSNAAEVAQRWVTAATRLYEVGEGSLLDVLEALQARVQARLAELDVLEQRVDAQLAWMRAAGDLADPRLEAACGLGREGAP